MEHAFDLKIRFPRAKFKITTQQTTVFFYCSLRESVKCWDEKEVWNSSNQYYSISILFNSIHITHRPSPIHLFLHSLFHRIDLPSPPFLLLSLIPSPNQPPHSFYPSYTIQNKRHSFIPSFSHIRFNPYFIMSAFLLLLFSYSSITHSTSQSTSPCLH